ncbi:hypothetical protein [Saccharopolyspora spinosa]|uniref:hypothetical protein n=1 Tax=Saccharopolyspora spinosa TaxID=60894 RepID=UPI00023791F1|nr:hypothetical protein [Saccharopolyspora spinosa]
MGDIQADITTADQLAQDSQQALALAADRLSEALHSLIQTTQSSQNDEIGRVATTLVRLTEPLPGGLPGWWASDAPTGAGPDWEGGHGNLVVAHGISVI